VLRGGRRIGRHSIVVHAAVRTPEISTSVAEQSPGPKFGLIVSKSVGNSVERHRAARILRAAAMSVAKETTPHAAIVIRALPAIAGASSNEVEEQLRKGLSRLNILVAQGRST
jgi:ribonuclease P protein component